MRVKAGTVTRRRHKKWLKMAEGYWGLKSAVFRRAKEAVIRALNFAYRDRRQRKRDMRRWWIVRINAAARANGTTYGRLIAAMHRKNMAINRKMLADLAVRDPQAFSAVVQAALA